MPGFDFSWQEAVDLLLWLTLFVVVSWVVILVTFACVLLWWDSRRGQEWRVRSFLRRMKLGRFPFVARDSCDVH